MKAIYIVPKIDVIKALPVASLLQESAWTVGDNKPITIVQGNPKPGSGVHFSKSNNIWDDNNMEEEPYEWGDLWK